MTKLDDIYNMLSAINDKVNKQEAAISKLAKIGNNTNTKLLSIREAAETLKRSTATIRRWIREDKIKAIKLNNGGDKDQYLIQSNEIEKLIKRSQV